MFIDANPKNQCGEGSINITKNNFVEKWLHKLLQDNGLNVCIYLSITLPFSIENGSASELKSI